MLIQWFFYSYTNSASIVLFMVLTGMMFSKVRLLRLEKAVKSLFPDSVS